ncbi:hypothetical protein [Streptomyces sp. ME19-01-6]|uniref:hypothetical protein n=1 Tax=Streptomyces sp. ME19-01-6 TaxID=3028686 RepID=UPI0029BAA67A|nr:hypothetical protein [Streptomyces sp. ME19-01-6]MDX3232979.1 hypothetical protein [Streptomyces sp. ME19-01-6]
MPLQSVPAPAEEQRPKRSFPELVAAIYEDPRVGHEACELLLAVAYAVDLAKREEGVSPLTVARRKLGVEHGRKARYDRLIADDAPRYELPYQAQKRCNLGPACEAPRLRPYRPRPSKPSEPDPTAPVPIRVPEPPPELLAALKAQAAATYAPPRDWRTEDGVCGAGSHHRILEKDPRTGWVTAHWFCKRHSDHAERVAEQVRAQNEAAPKPIPNRGGLLPCYFKADWEKVYRHYRGQFWEPPSYGLCADDWPTPGETLPLPSRGRLRMVVSVADLETEGASQ